MYKYTMFHVKQFYCFLQFFINFLLCFTWNNIVNFLTISTHLWRVLIISTHCLWVLTSDCIQVCNDCIHVFEWLYCIQYIVMYTCINVWYTRIQCYCIQVYMYFFVNFYNFWVIFLLGYHKIQRHISYN